MRTLGAGAFFRFFEFTIGAKDIDGDRHHEGADTREMQSSDAKFHGNGVPQRYTMNRGGTPTTPDLRFRQNSPMTAYPALSRRKWQAARSRRSTRSACLGLWPRPAPQDSTATNRPDCRRAGAPLRQVPLGLCIEPTATSTETPVRAPCMARGAPVHSRAPTHTVPGSAWSRESWAGSRASAATDSALSSCLNSWPPARRSTRSTRTSTSLRLRTFIRFSGTRRL